MVVGVWEGNGYTMVSVVVSSSYFTLYTYY